MQTWQCDVAILGAGPAGLAAALAAAKSGKQVLVIDDNPHPGGQIWRAGQQSTLPALAQRYRDAIAANSQITLLSGMRLIARPSSHSLLVESADSGGVIHWKKLILCCGARELALPFPGWTLPGVTGAGGLQAQIKNGLRLDNEKVVIAGSGPLLLAVADSVSKAGGEVVQIVEQAPLLSLLRFGVGLWRWPGKLRQLVSLAPRGYRTDSQVVSAEGESALSAVTVRRQGKTLTLNCTRLAIGYGLIPNLEPGLFFGCEVNGEAIAVDEWQATRAADIYAAGECTGFGGSELALVEGKIAGYAAAENLSRAQAMFPQRAHWQRFADAVNSTFALPERLKLAVTPDTLLCRCEDVRCGDVDGESDWRQAKLAQRCGMGACQGRTCAASARWLYGWPIPQPREPLAPARLDTLLMLATPRAPDE
ncbi:FAD-dependent oxidoreductase [Citrobacter tructae]|uniref:FAD-dependent oxidoreductase n=1 Tax=Citrobacter tructae TaxID=2562449 RepID=UPI003F56A29E